MILAAFFFHHFSLLLLLLLLLCCFALACVACLRTVRVRAFIASSSGRYDKHTNIITLQLQLVFLIENTQATFSTHHFNKHTRARALRAQQHTKYIQTRISLQVFGQIGIIFMNVPRYVLGTCVQYSIFFLLLLIRCLYSLFLLIMIYR